MTLLLIPSKLKLVYFHNSENLSSTGDGSTTTTATHCQILMTLLLIPSKLKLVYFQNSETLSSTGDGSTTTTTRKQDPEAPLTDLSTTTTPAKKLPTFSDVIDEVLVTNTRTSSRQVHYLKKIQSK